MPETGQVKVDLRLDATQFNRAIEAARQAFARMGEQIAAAMKPMARLGRDLNDAEFIREGGRFYWTIVTCDDGVTRSIRRRDFTGWRT